MRRFSTCALPALFALTLTAATVATTGCDALSASEPDAPEVQIVEGFPHILPDSIRQDSLRIDTASVDGDLLRLDVSYEGGCAEHAFTLYSSEYLAESLPPQTNTFLSHDAGGDTCTETVQEELTFDLSPLKELRWDETLIIALRPYRTYDGPGNWDQLRYER
jgi:hypothetical protein